jgi:hypothetical protein
MVIARQYIASPRLHLVRSGSAEHSSIGST